MFLKLESTNPNFSHIIAKNPQTIIDNKQPFHRRLRRGNIYGWFANPENSTFCIYFKDSDVETSYGREFEYLDQTRYSSPQLLLGIVNEVLRTASTAPQPEYEPDLKHVCRATVTMDINAGLVRRLTNVLTSDVKVAFNQIYSNNDTLYKVVIMGNSVYQVLTTLQIVACLACASNPNIDLAMKKADIAKYLRILAGAKAPYYVWHLFLSRNIQDRGTFESFRSELDASGMLLNFGNTQVQRLDAIRKALSAPGKKDVLLDIGCGELHHAVKLVNLYDQIVAYDSDPEVAEIATGKIKARRLEDNITFLNHRVCGDDVPQLDDAYGGQGYDVLLTEVVEHMEKSEAAYLVRYLAMSDAGRIVITVPNRDFNINYGLKEGEIRHLDHKWEPNQEEFRAFLHETCGGTARKISQGPCCDFANGQGASLIAIIE